MNDIDDSRFAALRLMTGGMTSARIAKVIYYLSHALDHDKELYVEQGTWTGFTLAAAGMDGMPLVVGIDPYDIEFGNPELAAKGERQMQQNMEFFQIPAVVLAEDFRNVQWKEKYDKTIGALFVDADHMYQDVLDGLAWAEPHLSDEAVIILDDVRAKQGDDKGVELAMWEWLAAHPQYRLEAFVRGELWLDQYVHNGVAIISYRKVV